MPLIGRKAVSKVINEDVYLQLNNGLKSIYFSGLQLIIGETPAKEGRARNNWFLTVSAPSSKVTDKVSKAGTNSLNEMNKMPVTILGKKLFFTNNLDYILKLENGSSDQAPTGMARKTLILMQQKIRSL